MGGQSYTCVANTDGKYLAMKHWEANLEGKADCSANPTMSVNLYHGKCTDIFGTDFGSGKFICAADGSIYVDSCSEGETPVDVWGLMSSMETPFDSSCTADEDGGSQQFSCDNDKRYVLTQYNDDSTCKILT